MKHRALSMLLALLMVVSLLPIAAVAGNEEVSATAHEGKLEMRYNGSYGNGKYMPAGEHKVELRLWQGDENGTEYKLQEADKDYLHWGDAVKNVQYTTTTQGEDGEESIPCWSIQLEGNAGETGYIEYSAEGISMSRVMITLQAATGNDDKKVTEKDAVNTEPDGGPKVLCEENGTTYYLGVGDIDGGESYLFGPRSSCELSSDEDARGFAFSAQVFTRDGDNYTPVSAEKRAELEQKYLFVLEIRPKASCIGYCYPEEEDGVYRFTTKSLGDWIIRAFAREKTQEEGVVCNAQLTVSLKRTLPNGILGMSYDGSDYRNGNFAFTEGVYEVQLAVGNRHLNKDSMLSENNVPEDEKLTYGGAVQIIERTGGSWWRIRIEEGEQTTGWIQYGTNESNRVTITILPSRGDKVEENNRIVQGSNEFDWASWGTVMPFEWNGQTYYLGTAAWSTKKPYAMGGRGVEEAEDYYAASVFSLMSGEVGSMSATYQLREDIRAAMMQDGYTFELTLVPTDIGCAYYPAIRDVKMNITQQGDGTETTFTSEWQGQKFSKDSVGVWVYDARLYKDEKQVQQNLSNCKYSCNIQEKVDLEGQNVSAINREIENELKKFPVQENDGLYNNVVTLVLPAGELEGQIVIPQTNAIVTVYGNDYGQGRIATTLKGGIRFDNNNTNHVGFIHFIGEGKNVEWVDEENEIRNEAVYGEGQGAPEVCLFEGYHIAIHSTDRPSWGSQDSVYINNNVAICQDGENGGQTIMRNNWFVDNNTAVVMKRSVSVDYLMSFKNRFINNEIDLSNESENVLWLSQNFFYHDFDGENSWRPILWEEKNGILVLNNDGGLLYDSSENAPAFMDSNYNTSKNDVKYLNFLPLFSTEGDSPKPMAYPLARTQDCSSFFYPNWGRDGENYPSYVLWGETISEDDLNNLRCYSFDKQNNVVTGTLDFGASLAEAEN
jgi:hypothetical protein